MLWKKVNLYKTTLNFKVDSFQMDTLWNSKMFFAKLVREAAKKVPFLVAGPLRGGWGLNGVHLRKNELF